MNIERSELDEMILTKPNSDDPVNISNPLKKRILSLKGFWKCWGDNSTKIWTNLTINSFEEYLASDSGPNLATTSTALDPAPPTTPTDVMAITNAVSAALLSKPPTSRTDIFMKNKGGGDGIKPLKETKQWNTWQCTFLSIAHAYDFKDITDATYVPDPMDSDATKVFELQQKHAFGILVASVKEPSVLPVICPQCH